MTINNLRFIPKPAPAGGRMFVAQIWIDADGKLKYSTEDGRSLTCPIGSFPLVAYSPQGSNVVRCMTWDEFNLKYDLENY